REARAEAAPLARSAHDVEGRAVARERVLHDREPEARAARLPRAPAIDPVEPLGEPRNVLRRDADAGVLDIECGPLRRAMPCEVDASAFGRVADRVAPQVRERARELLLASHDVDAAIAVHLDAMAPSGERAGFGAEALDELRHLDRLLERGWRRGFERRKREEVFDQPLHAARLLAHE